MDSPWIVHGYVGLLGYCLRMYEHRSTVKPNNKTTGNFRLRQYYACSGGHCEQFNFKIFVIQKLPGSSRTVDEPKRKSGLAPIDSGTSVCRKGSEDGWIRKLHT